MKPGEPPAPFSCTFTPNLPELLQGLGITLVISTYQAGKLIFVSAQDTERLIQLPRSFRHAMAVCVNRGKLAVATRDEVIVLADAPALAPGYPAQPDTYDGLFVPRATYYTGHLDLHGLSWGTHGLLGVNTLFSCLSLINENYSFTPWWKPGFISRLASEDRCHLNGMAVDDRGDAQYVTAFGASDRGGGWRETIPAGGVVIHVPSGEMAARDLPMPHSPRLFDGRLYLVLSATGELVRLDTDSGRRDVVHRFDGFLRGLAKHGDYLFIGMSRLRSNSSTFRDLPIAEKAKTSGVVVLHLPRAAVVGRLEYRSSVDEIFDVQVLPGCRRPGIVSAASEWHGMSLTTPEATYWAKRDDDAPRRRASTPPSSSPP